MTLSARLAERAKAHHLFVSGVVVEGAGSIALLSPDEPGFWAHVQAQPEFLDGGPDPLDRWSTRVIGALADGLGGKALFPFGGPPYQPFITWALASGAFHASPVQLLVHARMGLWSSFRGAIAFDAALPRVVRASPCVTCEGKPCLTACPVGAMTATGYDTGACHAYLDTPMGGNCLTGGCAVRNACPVSQSYGRVDGQSAHHMRHFHK